MHEILITPDDLIDFANIVNNGNLPIVNRQGLHSTLSSFHYYDNITLQISCIFRSIIQNHAFMDGNKRVAVLFLFTMCHIHNIQLPRTDDEIFNIVMVVIKQKPSVEMLTKMLFE